jgi:transcriptional regulator with XRE-family HTH domain
MRPRYYFREWRKYRRLTQEDLAERIGVSASSISQLETGKQGFTGDMLEMLASALGCQSWELLQRDPADEDLVALIRGLSPDQQREAIQFVKFLLNRKEHS